MTALIHPGLLAGLLLVAAGSCLSAFTPRLRADDTVRHAQEEFRRRNLYFGDIDGRLNRGVLGALRRYQERKGFPVTGQLDEATLRSLNIPIPPGNAAGPEADPWPETPVLKSDAARRPPPLGVTTVIDDPSPSPGGGRPPGAESSVRGVNPGRNGGPPIVMERGTPQMAEANAAATPAAVAPGETPASPGVSDAPGREAGLISPETARAFLESYLRAGSTNDLRAEMAFYADSVDYFNKGPASRDYIARDVRQYYRRWPERRFELLDRVTVSRGPAPGQSRVDFRLSFSYHTTRNREVHVRGRTDNTFILEGSRPGDLRIVGMKEQRVRR